ncbi:hypothetical protein WR25_14191 [Diploscapter pachys]|uniref:C2H2-type domain-containing protein n=1 Tax=Diploscapter pachys TaxID=2018661 RepID=A0A2A2LZT4_9BILA|nr:hypothetical protein WR25_14191 [Diploscapter pachys]
METIEIPFEDGELSPEDGSDKTQEGSEYPEQEENEITNSSSSNGNHSDHSERNVEENNNYPVVEGKVPEAVRKLLANVEKRLSCESNESDSDADRHRHSDSESRSSHSSRSSNSHRGRKSRRRHKSRKGSKRKHRSSSRENRKRKRRDNSSSRSRSKSRSGSERRRYRSSSTNSSSSRATFEDFPVSKYDEEEKPYNCKACKRTFYTIKELAEHDVRAHDQQLDCAICEKKSISVAKLAAHFVFRHPEKRVICACCGEGFGKGSSEEASKSDWEDFRIHSYKEIVKKKMYNISEKYASKTQHGDAVALRGVGLCPHGPPAKCKNFPTCPGSKCLYSHGLCRYDTVCNKSTCPFDHKNRPRTCMACVQDIKVGKTG